MKLKQFQADLTAGKYDEKLCKLYVLPKDITTSFYVYELHMQLHLLRRHLLLLRHRQKQLNYLNWRHFEQLR